MSDFSLHSESVDVEQIMRRIRTRIREKRGVDYTEDEVRQLASVKLERFLDPRSVRSDLLTHFRQRPSVPLPGLTPLNYAFEDETIYASSRGASGRLLRWCRRLLNPVLKLFFNPNPIIHVLHVQGQVNTNVAKHFEELSQRLSLKDELYFELLNNLVVEVTRLGIELKNSKMRLESLATRLEFDERRARALEGIVQYRAPAPSPSTEAPPAPEGREPQTEGDDESRPARRRRRRRGRRRGTGFGSEATAAPATGESTTDEASDFSGEGDEGAAADRESATAPHDMTALPEEHDSRRQEQDSRTEEPDRRAEEADSRAQEPERQVHGAQGPAQEEVRSEDPPSDGPRNDNRGSGDQ